MDHFNNELNCEDLIGLEEYEDSNETKVSKVKYLAYYVAGGEKYYLCDTPHQWSIHRHEAKVLDVVEAIELEDSDEFTQIEEYHKNDET